LGRHFGDVSGEGKLGTPWRVVEQTEEKGKAGVRCHSLNGRFKALFTLRVCPHCRASRKLARGDGGD